MSKFGKKCEIKSNAIFGRYVEVTEDVAAGEVILYEKPILILPHWDSKLLCSNCFTQSCKICEKCNIFPLCFNCKTHCKFDCDFFNGKNISKNFLLENFSLFGPLKCLLFIENSDNESFTSEFLKMDSHLEERRKETIWENFNQTIFMALENLKIGTLLKKFNFDLIQQICGILDVNTFEIRNKNMDSLRGLYLNGALLPHNCTPNTMISVDANFQMKIYAAVDIKTGNIVYNNYTNPLMGTAERKLNLNLGKYFECRCERCEDPTEFGTYLSAIKCKNCTGYLLKTVTDYWVCEQCGFKTEDKIIDGILTNASNKVSKARDNLREMEILINDLSQIFHQNHFLIIDLKQNIASILRQICQDAEEMSGIPPSKSILQRKLQLCEEIIPVLRKLQPGISRLTAIALFEYSGPFIELARRDMKKMNPKDYLANLKKGEEILRESVSMLLHELPNTPEGSLARKVLFDLKKLKDEIKSF